MSLVDTWLASEKSNGVKTDQDALNRLNNATGLFVRHNRMWEWKNAKQRPPTLAINYMLKVSVLYALKTLKPRQKLTTNQVIKLADMLAIPTEKS